MKIKAVFTDLDETLLSSDKTISKLNAEAVRICLEQGIYVSLVTGRGEADIQKYIKELSLQNSIHICQNGLILYRPFPYERIILGRLTAEQFRAIRLNLKKHNFTYFIFDEECALFESEEAIRIAEEDDPRRTFKKRVADFDKVSPPLKLSCLFKNEEEEKLLRSIAAQTGTQTSKVAKTNINFLPLGIDKSFAIKNVIDQLNIHPDEIITIGDTLCDLLTIKNFKYSFAPSNAEHLLKKHAYCTLPYSNDEDVLYHIIRDYTNIL